MSRNSDWNKMIKRKKNSNKDQRKLKFSPKQTWETGKTKTEVQNFRNTCYVDETIINDKEVKYGALVFSSRPSKSIDRLNVIVRKNIHLIRGNKEKFLNEPKSIFFKITGKLKEAKEAIDYSEIYRFETYSSKSASTELKNRNVALEKLIRKVPCKYIIIDDYDNPIHKERMIELGKKIGKEVIFVDSKSSVGVQLVDVLLRVYQKMI